MLRSKLLTRQLLGKAGIDFDLRSKIIKLVVHKVEIMVDGFEIYFHVGESHFKTALGKDPSASFFVSFLRNHGAQNKKPSLGVPGEGLKLNSGQSAKNQMCERSTRLTNGGPGENRTPTPLRALDFLTTLFFTSSLNTVKVQGVCGLDYALTVAFALGPARLVSTPSEEISLLGLARH